MSTKATTPVSARRAALRERRNPVPAPVIAETDEGVIAAGAEPEAVADVEQREPQRVEAHATVHQPMRADVQEPARRTRRRKLTNNDDVFYIPVEEIPEGSTYEWKRYSVMGLEDPFYIAQMREQGWEPVDPKRHPNWVPPGYSQPSIIKGGQMLMERPVELTQEARREERQAAKRQVIDAEARLGMTPRGELSRSADPRVAPRVQKEMMRPLLVAED